VPAVFLLIAALLVPLPSAAEPVASASPETTTPDSPTAAEERGELARQSCLEAVAHSIRLHQLDPASVDADAICEATAEGAAEGVPRRTLADEISSEIRKARLPFAKPGARHDRGARYSLPYEVWMPRMLSQASGGPTHNTPDNYHALDFLIPTGRKVLAARAGRVVAVVDGAPEDSAEPHSGNTVTVLHEDDTWAVYAHLKAGPVLEEGQRVRRGQWIANSGNSGSSKTPHLHLVVQRMVASGEVESVQIRFGQSGTEGNRLESGRHWGGSPPPKRQLHVYIDGQRSRPNRPIAVGYGSRLKVRVELVQLGGSPTDVTTNPRVHYETMTLWNLHSPEPGQLVVEPVPEIEGRHVKKALPLLNQAEGMVIIYYGVPRDPDYGMERVPFQVFPATPSS